MEEETKLCDNCKREIPAVNYVVHSAHCTRNIKPCIICKEPIPISDLEKHHKTFHEIVPCKQCGEGVSGTDLEDHIRDSCAKTISPCRFCELELPRCDIPEHEDYCGTRTERCNECSELIMMKYLQLHLDSNHTFLKLSDEPGPTASWSNIQAPIVQTTSIRFNEAPSSSNVNTFDRNIDLPMKIINNQVRLDHSPELTKKKMNTNVKTPKRDVLKKQINENQSAPCSSRNSNIDNEYNAVKKKDTKICNQMIGDAGSGRNLQKVNNHAQESLNKQKSPLNGSSRPYKKSKAAPQPPLRNGDQKPFWSAELRRQREETDRRERNEYNLANGLPPVLSALDKLEKLRNMSKLMNPDNSPPPVRRNGLNDERCKSSKRVEPPRKLGSHSGPGSHSGLGGHSGLGSQNFVVTPMTGDEFVNRYQRLQVNSAVNEPNDGENRDQDRFSNLRTELQQLRRGLNEVTAPYNDQRNAAPVIQPARVSPTPQSQNIVQIPCEFCGMPISFDQLIIHQTGCRPDLCCEVQQDSRESGHSSPPDRPKSPRTRSRSGRPPPPPPSSHEEPFLPCEFCARSFALRDLMIHQASCLMNY